MALDNSIFGQANRPNVPLITPNEAFAQASDVQNRLQAVQKFRSEQAVGQAYQQATRPDGSLDTNKLRSIIATDPHAALGAQQAAGNAQQLAGEQQSVALRQNQFIGQSIGAVLDLPDGQLHDGVVQAVMRAKSAGLIDDQGALRLMGNFPNDPGQLRSRLRQVQLGLQSPGAQQEQIYGAGGTRDTGPTIETGVVASPARGGGFQPTSSTDVYPSRSQLAGQQTGVDADGNPIATTTADRLNQQGRPDLAGPAAVPPGPAANARRFGEVPRSLLPPGYTGRPSSPAAGGGERTAPGPGGERAETPPAFAAEPPGPEGASPPSGAVRTGLSPARSAALQTEGTQSAGAFQQIAEAGTAAQTRGATLDNMLSDTRAFSTGPLADRIAKLREIGGRFGIPVDKDATSAAESFNKLAANLASQQGAGSDARLAVGQAGNPHSDLSPDGVDLMLRQLRGNEDYLIARARLAAGHDPSDRRGFESKVGAALDPRTFQYDRMSGPQKANYFKNLGDDKAKSAFITAHERAQQLLGGG